MALSKRAEEFLRLNLIMLTRDKIRAEMKNAANYEERRSLVDVERELSDEFGRVKDSLWFDYRAPITGRPVKSFSRRSINGQG